MPLYLAPSGRSVVRVNSGADLGRQRRFNFIDTASVTWTITNDNIDNEFDVQATAAGGSSHNILSATHSDSVTATVVRGDLIVGNSTPAWQRLARGTTDQVLSTNGVGDLVWVAQAGGTPSWSRPFLVMGG